MDKKKPENRFFTPSDENADSQKAGRILYIVIISVLCVSAIIIGIVAALNRDKTPESPTPDSSESDTVTPPEQTNPDNDADVTLPTPDEDVNVTPTPVPDTVPIMTVPIAGAVTEPHNPDMPVLSLTMGDYRTHEGIDISAAIGTTVSAVAEGTIAEIWEDPMMGTSLSISMKGQSVAIYQNLGEIAEGIAVGSIVKAGDALATVGESALLECGEEPHLHFALTVDGKTCDPMSYFSEESINASLTVDSSYEDE